MVPFERNHGWRAALYQAQPRIIIERHIERLHQPASHHVCVHASPLQPDVLADCLGHLPGLRC